MRDRIDAATFYGVPSPPPRREPGPLARAAASPGRFGGILLAFGAAGILVQRSLLTQLVVGAPVFEEMAKVGLAILATAPRPLRALAVRLPAAWLSGAGFAWLEHATTYPDEPLAGQALRLVFHAGTAGLSMAFYAALAEVPDARVRWASTLVSTLLHWLNNFGVLVLAVASVVLPLGDATAFLFSGLVTLAAIAATVLVLARPGPARARVGGLAARLLSPLEQPAD